MTELEKLKQLLGITSTDKDFVLQFAIDKAIDMILNYCNIDEIPTKLNNVLLSIAMDIYRSESLGEEEKAGVITSIKEGDTSTNYADTSKNSTGDILDAYKKQLQPFRKVRWI